MMLYFNKTNMTMWLIEIYILSNTLLNMELFKINFKMKALKLILIIIGEFVMQYYIV